MPTVAKDESRVLTAARCKALSHVFLDVFKLLMVGVFLSEAFGRLKLPWRAVAFVVLGSSFILGIWFARNGGAKT
jgi:hypothetical protein